MSRRGVILVVLSVGLLVFFAAAKEAPVATPTPAVSPAADVAATEPAAEPAVRVQHELIEVAVTRPLPRPPAPPRARSRPVRSARLREEAPPLVRRLLVGDGQFKPEPFPRPTR